MAFNNFKQDLAQSEIGVNKLVAHLKSKGVTDVELCDTKEYDVAYTTANNKRITLEVKEDFRYTQTGNVAIEYEQRGKPTGISVSSADYYVYKLSENFYSIKCSTLKENLKQSVKTKETKKKTFTDKGNQKEIKVLLVPATVFTGWCNRIN